MSDTLEFINFLGDKVDTTRRVKLAKRESSTTQDKYHKGWRVVGVSPDAVAAALVDRVAGLALLEYVGALGGVGAGEVEFDRLLGFTAATFLDHALDRIAHRLRPLAVEHDARREGAAKRDDPGEQNPAGDGVVIVLHVRSL